MFTISLNATDIRNAQRFVTEDVSRPLLQGISVESTGVICATNGHALLAIAPDSGVNTNRPHRDVLLKFAKRIPGWATGLTLKIAENMGEHSYVVDCTNGRGKLESIVATEIIGPFCNWRQVLPHDDLVSERHPFPPVNGEYVARFAACSEKGSVRFAAQENAARAVRVYLPESRYVGVLMPLHHDQCGVDQRALPESIMRRIEPTAPASAAARAA
jgi:hypothetical protein